MSKKGFTLIEMLAVITVLAIMATIAVISVSNSRKKVNEKEITALNSTIISAFQNYRIKNYVSDNTEININNLNFTNNLYYNNEECSNITGSSIKYVIRGKIENSSSLEEVFCIKLVCNNKIIINDYENNSYCINN